MKGQCLCGTVQFEISGKVPNLYQCHCSDCRKATGSASNSATIVPREKFQWVKGTDSINAFRKPNGYRNDFCTVCGSAVPNYLRGHDLVWIPAGCLEDTDGLAIVAHLHMASHASWEDTAAGAEQFESAPELDLLVNKLTT